MERRAWRRWISWVTLVAVLAMAGCGPACKSVPARVIVVGRKTATAGLLDVLMPPLMIVWVMEWFNRNDPPDPNRTVYQPLVLP